MLVQWPIWIEQASKLHSASVLVQSSRWIEQACYSEQVSKLHSKRASAVIKMDRASVLLRAGIQAAQQAC